MRKGLIGRINTELPDVILMQEAKTYGGIAKLERNAEFRRCLQDLRDSGYMINLNECTDENLKGHAGTLVATRKPAVEIRNEIGHERTDREGRVQTIIFSNYILINAYLKQPGLYDEHLEQRADFIAAFGLFKQQLEAEFPEKPIVLMGDMNVAPTSKDSKKQGAGATAKLQQQWGQALRGWSMADVYDSLYPQVQGPKRFTWWWSDAKKKWGDGLRLDHVLVNERHLPGGDDQPKFCVESVTNMHEMEGSDHIPIKAVIAIDVSSELAAIKAAEEQRTKMRLTPIPVDKQRAAAEAQTVAGVLGSSMMVFKIGNFKSSKPLQTTEISVSPTLMGASDRTGDDRVIIATNEANCFWINKDRLKPQTKLELHLASPAKLRGVASMAAKDLKNRSQFELNVYEKVRGKSRNKPRIMGSITFTRVYRSDEAATMVDRLTTLIKVIERKLPVESVRREYESPLDFEVDTLDFNHSIATMGDLVTPKINVNIGGATTMALADTGASHCIVSLNHLRHELEWSDERINASCGRNSGNNPSFKLGDGSSVQARGAVTLPIEFTNNAESRTINQKFWVLESTSIGVILGITLWKETGLQFDFDKQTLCLNKLWAHHGFPLVDKPARNPIMNTFSCLSKQHITIPPWCETDVWIEAKPDEVKALQSITTTCAGLTGNMGGVMREFKMVAKCVVNASDLATPRGTMVKVSNMTDTTQTVLKGEEIARMTLIGEEGISFEIEQPEEKAKDDAMEQQHQFTEDRNCSLNTMRAQGADQDEGRDQSKTRTR
jgi:exodeoxyribonuclease III